MAAKAAWERQQAIDNTLRECAQLRAQQRFAEAIELVESTLRDYSSDPALVDLLAKLEEDWKGKRRADAVRKAADQAAQMLQRKQTVNARRFPIRQALAQYPGEPLLADLLKQADDELRAIEMARAIESILREASEFATAKNFGRALSAYQPGFGKVAQPAAICSIGAIRLQTPKRPGSAKRRSSPFPSARPPWRLAWISEAPSIWSVERYARIPARRNSINSKSELRAIGSNTSVAKQSRALQ